MDKLKEYAQLIVNVGLNVQKGENVVITCQISTPELAYHVMEESYKNGAREVTMRWIDDKTSRIKYLNDDEELFESFPNWTVEYYNHYNSMETNYLNIYSSDPESLKGVDPNRVMKFSKASNKALKDHVSKVMGNAKSWCVVAVPSIAWAKKVFPNETEENAVQKLWDVILDIVRVGEGKAIENWNNHLDNMLKANNFMNSMNFKSLHFKSSNGTDLKVGLVKDHIWCGGKEQNIVSKKYFVANMPTEECFTMPDANNVNGVVYSSKPLSYNGNLIDEFMLEFKDGEVVNFSAKVGEDVLISMLDTDLGARRLGEVALVPYDSPISNSNVLFYNTLFDENASCHLALGRAYPINLKDSDSYSEEEQRNLGMNMSAIHEDFMIGTSDTTIIGEKHDGELVDVFVNGNFAF